MGSSVLETVLHATLSRSRKKLLFAAVKANAFYSYAMSKDMVEYEDGGDDITNPIISGRNPNVKSYSYYDELPVAQTNEFNTAKYGWARMAGSVSISDQEQDENQNIYEIMQLIGKKRGAIISGGNIDDEKTSKIILEDFRSGKLGKITLEKP